jgi:Leucine rich repeat
MDAMSRLRRFLLPTLIFAAALFVCGKLLLTPVKTLEVGRSGYSAWGAIGALENGWPWVYWKYIDGIVFPPNPPSSLDISYSRGLLFADVAVLSLMALATWLLSFWVWRCCQYRFRYSLRGLLLATVFIAIPMGWIGRQIYDWRREQFWIAELDDVNIQIAQDAYSDLGRTWLSNSFSNVTVEAGDFPEWLRRLWPESFWPIFRRVKSIEVKPWVTLRKRAYEPVLEAALHEMQHITTLHVLRDCEFKFLDPSAFSNIESLAMDEPIDDEMLRVIARFPQLRCLSFNASRTTEDGLACLADCRRLEELSITSVSIAGILQIAKCARIQRLEISASSVLDASIAPLSCLSGLRSLSLDCWQLTDAAMDTIEKLHTVEELHLGYPNLTDAGAKRLSGLPNLKYLSLNERLLSAATIDQLKQQIPVLQAR